MEEPADGSTFVALNMGQWTLSHEKKVEWNACYECSGVLRPGFEAAPDPQKTLAPSNNVQANPLALFTNKVLHMKSKALVAL